ncbi:MAG: hypothetical protein JXR34_10150 [Bacteroidales bacterium]|nr:hypothetical protein [Bacteroidales bacterium]
MQRIIRKTISRLSIFYNHIENYWHGDQNHRILGSLIFFIFLFSLGLIHLNRLGLIHSFIAEYVPTNYFAAIVISFWILLIFEIFSLIFILPASVSSSMVKQFEIFSLILLRDVFKSIEKFSEIENWANLSTYFYPMVFDAVGALLIFIGIYHIKRLQLHKNITANQDKQNQFIEIKKVLSLILTGIFIGIIIFDTFLFINQSNVFQLFTLFYSVMIFFDVMIVIISLRYNLSYMVLFRYSAFTIATILLRISLTAPAMYKALIGVSSVAFIYLLTMYYSKYMRDFQSAKN